MGITEDQISEIKQYIEQRIARGLDTPELEGSEVLDLIAERDQLKSEVKALNEGYFLACQREHELRTERQNLRLALKYAVDMFNRMSSADGSGHADIGRAVLKMAGSAMGDQA